MTAHRSNRAVVVRESGWHRKVDIGRPPFSLILIELIKTGDSSGLAATPIGIERARGASEELAPIQKN